MQQSVEINSDDLSKSADTRSGTVPEISSSGNLIILTHFFPLSAGEDFLTDELKEIAPYFKNILICPNNVGRKTPSTHSLPENVTVLNLEDFSHSPKKYELIVRILPVLIREFFRIRSKKLFFSMLKFNLSLLKQCYLRAVNLRKEVTDPADTIIYSYWCDDLAITGSFCRILMPDICFVSRAHGFDVFEEQSDYNHIFFRQFQLAGLNRLLTVSKAGSEHLKNKNPEFKNKIDFQYLGVRSDEKICFEQTDKIRLVTCSHIRSIKRLNLLIRALSLMKVRELEWHVIGEGPDWEVLKKLSVKLSVNCKTIFHGHLSMADIHALYGRLHFDFLVSLSSSEGLPVSMMEAISHGIPVIATDVGGCSEIVNETTGILIPADFSDQELAAIIENCKSGIFNHMGSRQAIVSFWQENFNAGKNYRKFTEKVKLIKQKC